MRSVIPDLFLAPTNLEHETGDDSDPIGDESVSIAFDRSKRLDILHIFGITLAIFCDLVDFV